MSKLDELLQTHRLDDQTILRRSLRLERLRDEDVVLLARRAEMRKRGPSPDYRGAQVAKPRSGRGLRASQLSAARAARPLTPVVRAKLVRVLADLLDGKVEPATIRGALEP